MEILNMACCGVGELKQIFTEKTPQAVLKVFCKSRVDLAGTLNFNRAFYVFTQAFKKDSSSDQLVARLGEKLEAFIEKNKMGTVVKTVEMANPNTTNMITVFVWSPDTSAVSKWYAKELAKKDDTPTITGM